MRCGKSKEPMKVKVKPAKPKRVLHAGPRPHLGWTLFLDLASNGSLAYPNLSEWTSEISPSGREPAISHAHTGVGYDAGIPYLKAVLLSHHYHDHIEGSENRDSMAGTGIYEWPIVIGSPSRQYQGWVGRDAVYRGSAIEPTLVSFSREEYKTPPVDGRGVSTPKIDLRDEFKRFSEKLWEETEVVSSLSEIYSNPNYVRVIALGVGVIPFILEELKSEPKPWFLALRSLTGRKDVGANTPGKFADMADAWIKWGADNGYP
jgi:hypothetical protein